ARGLGCAGCSPDSRVDRTTRHPARAARRRRSPRRRRLTLKSEPSRRMAPLQFKTSERYTLGVELELQVLNSRDYDLVGAAGDLLALLDKVPHPGEIKPEITEAMIEVSTGIQHGYTGLLSELTGIREAMVRQAQRLNLGIAGGGTH